MKLRFIILFIIVGSQMIVAQNENNVLAKIGDKAITVEEFKYRYEFTPQVNRKYNDAGKAKEELLYTLIAENLFALEAEAAGYDTLQSMKINYLPLEKMHVRDELYKKNISDKVELDIKQFNRGLELAQQKLFVDFIYSKDKSDIYNAFELLSSNSNFDSLVTKIENAEYVSDPYEVSYGKMYYEAEEAIYNLDMFEFTEPIESPDGWYIFRLISKVPVIFNSVDQKNSLVKKVVEGRIEDSIYNSFWSNFFRDKKVNTDGTLFWYFVEEMQKLIAEIKSEQNLKENEKITVTNSDLSKFKYQLHPDSLKKEFIKFDPNPLTFEQFINDFSFEGFYTNTTDINQIAAQLNSRVKRQIELELLSREAYKKGMESLPEVKSSTDIWRENYLSTLYLKDIVLNTELSESDIKNYLSEQGDSTITETRVNIIEILTEDLDVIKEALNYSNDEAKFKEYAGQNTKREWTKNSSGEFGEFYVSEYGEIGKIAETMEVGDVYGPLETSDGYSLFKLIDKKTAPLNLGDSVINEDQKRYIKYQKVMENLENLAADLADKYDVSVNNDLLKSLNLLNAQMVVFRYMGFGGRISAFPYSSPFYKWKEKWEQKKKDLL